MREVEVDRMQVEVERMREVEVENAELKGRDRREGMVIEKGSVA
jgi:hypothetical protein